MPPKRGQRVKPYRPAKDPTKTRISPAVRNAIVDMVTQARTRKEAAEINGIAEDTLYRNLLKPDVIAFKNRVLREFREGTTERAYVRVADLSEKAKSEHVKLDANKTLLSLDERYIAASKQIHTGSIEHRVTPGYVIDVSDSDMTANQVIDVEIIND